MTIENTILTRLLKASRSGDLTIGMHNISSPDAVSVLKAFPDAEDIRPSSMGISDSISFKVEDVRIHLFLKERSRTSYLPVETPVASRIIEEAGR